MRCTRRSRSIGFGFVLVSIFWGLGRPAHAGDSQGVFAIGPDDQAREVGPALARDPGGNVLLTFSRVTSRGGRYSTVVQPLNLDGTVRARSRSWGAGAAVGIAYAGRNFVALTYPFDGIGAISSQPLDAQGKTVGAPAKIGVVSYINLRRNLTGGAILVGHDPARSRTLAQRFDPDGKPVGPLTTIFEGASDLVDCGSDLQGNLVVSWRRAFGEIVFRRYRADLTPLGEVRTAVPSGGEAVRISVAPDGRFALLLRDGGDHTVRLYLFRADGTLARPAIRLGATSIYGSQDLELGFDADGRWLALWSHFDSAQIVDSQVNARFVSGSGDQVGPPIRVAQAQTYISGLFHLSLVRTGPREFLVFWQRSIDVFVDDVVEGRRLYDVPGGDDPCVAQGRALRCDLRHDGGAAEVSYSLPLLSGDRPILLDADGDRRQDPCVVRGASLKCDANRDGQLERSFPLEPALFPADGQTLVGDLDGDGFESLCVYKAGTYHCRKIVQVAPVNDVSITFGDVGERPLLGDVDGDGRADVCAAGATQVRCAITHDGGTTQSVLPVALGPGEIPFLADLDNDGKADLCGYAGGAFRCHFAGRPDTVIPFGRAGAVPLFGNVDGR